MIKMINATMKTKLLLLAGTFLATSAFSQSTGNNPGSNHGNKFEQLGSILPTPNEYRTASGAPGPKYWQQRADYDIKCELDEKNLKLKGSETITYFNNSPNTLTNANYQNSNRMNNQVSPKQLDRVDSAKIDNGLGFNIRKLTDVTGKA